MVEVVEMEDSSGEDEGHEDASPDAPEEESDGDETDDEHMMGLGGESAHPVLHRPYM